MGHRVLRADLRKFFPGFRQLALRLAEFALSSSQLGLRLCSFRTGRCQLIPCSCQLLTNPLEVDSNCRQLLARGIEPRSKFGCRRSAGVEFIACLVQGQLEVSLRLPTLGKFLPNGFKQGFERSHPAPDFSDLQPRFLEPGFQAGRFSMALFQFGPGLGQARLEFGNSIFSTFQFASGNGKQSLEFGNVFPVTFEFATRIRQQGFEFRNHVQAGREFGPCLRKIGLKPGHHLARRLQFGIRAGKQSERLFQRQFVLMNFGTQFGNERFERLSARRGQARLFSLNVDLLPSVRQCDTECFILRDYGLSRTLEDIHLGEQLVVAALQALPLRDQGGNLFFKRYDDRAQLEQLFRLFGVFGQERVDFPFLSRDRCVGFIERRLEENEFFLQPVFVALCESQCSGQFIDLSGQADEFLVLPGNRFLQNELHDHENRQDEHQQQKESRHRVHEAGPNGVCHTVSGFS